jgi:hypothetical protein
MQLTLYAACTLFALAGLGAWLHSSWRERGVCVLAAGLLFVGMARGKTVPVVEKQYHAPVTKPGKIEALVHADRLREIIEERMNARPTEPITDAGDAANEPVTVGIKHE